MISFEKSPVHLRKTKVPAGDRWSIITQKAFARPQFETTKNQKKLVARWHTVNGKLVCQWLLK